MITVVSQGLTVFLFGLIPLLSAQCPWQWQGCMCMLMYLLFLPIQLKNEHGAYDLRLGEFHPSRALWFVSTLQHSFVVVASVRGLCTRVISPSASWQWINFFFKSTTLTIWSQRWYFLYHPHCGICPFVFVAASNVDWPPEHQHVYLSKTLLITLLITLTKYLKEAT